MLTSNALAIACMILPVFGLNSRYGIRRQTGQITIRTCPDGIQPVAACITYENSGVPVCGQGFYCTPEGFCCKGNQNQNFPTTTTTTTQNPISLRCLTGELPRQRCPSGRDTDCTSSPGSYCTTGYICCPRSQAAQGMFCADGTRGFGHCVGECLTPGYACFNNHCCPLGFQTFQCPDGQVSQTACDYLAYPGVGCVNGAECSPSGGCCSSSNQPNTQSCPDGSAAIGGCDVNTFGNTGCPVGFQCQGGLCCSSSFVTPPPQQQLQCSNGQRGIGGCNFVANPATGCSAGYNCDNGICCRGSAGPGPNPAVQIQCPSGEVSRSGCNFQAYPAIGCSPGFECENGACCSVNIGGGSVGQVCPNGQVSAGSCDYGRFAGTGCTAGFECQTGRNICCPSFSQQPPAIFFSNNNGFQTVCSNGLTTTIQCDFNRFSFSGCVFGNECQNGGCCPINIVGPQVRCNNGQTTTVSCNFGAFPGTGCARGFACQNAGCCAIDQLGK